MTATATIHRENSSIVQRPVVLGLKTWETTTSDGRSAVRPQKATWYPHIIRNEMNAADTVVVPMIGCPSCGGLSILSPSPKAAAAVSAMMRRPVPVAHKIDSYGKVSPDVRCTSPRCGFHRTVYLDRWTATGKALYCVVHTIGESTKLEFAYCHATNQREALAHLGQSRAYKIVDVAPAVGFYQDERTGKLSTSMGG